MSQKELEFTHKLLEGGNIMEKSHQKELQMDKDDIIHLKYNDLSEIDQKTVETKLSIAESHPENKKMILKDKSNSCKNYSQTMKLSQTSDQVLTLIDPGCKPFWNEYVQELSNELPLVTKTDYVESDLKYLKKSLKFLDVKSSLSTTLKLHQNKNSLKILSQLQHLLVQECMDYANTQTKCQMIYLPIKKKLKQVWKSWIQISIRIYNKSLEILKKKKISKYKLRNKIKQQFRDIIKKENIPNTSIEYAVFDAFQAFKMSKNAKPRNTNQISYSIAVDGRNIKNGFIYKTNTMRAIKNIHQKNKISTIMKKIFNKKINNIKTNKVCRIIFKRHLNKFYLSIPKEIKKTTKSNRNIISLDPGVRSFQTFYDIESTGEIGKNLFIKIKRLHKKCDQLNSKIKNEKKFYKKCNFKKAKSRIEEKIKNIVEDCHKKTCNFLTKYKYVLLPEFKVKSMIPGLKKYTRRTLLSLSHFKFKLRLAQKTSETDTTLIICNEAYTSKTCTKCGEINQKLNSKKNICM